MTKLPEQTHALGTRGPWTVQESNVKYHDPWLHVVRDEVTRPDGAAGSYCVAYLKSGVSVIAIDQHRQVFLTREYHYGVDRITLEAVSGGRDHDEEPIITARRELKEELGIEAGQWIDLGHADPFTANVVSPTQLFLATDLSFGDTQQEGTEQIQLVQFPWEQVLEMVYRSEISHAPSALCILKANAYLRGETSFRVLD